MSANLVQTVLTLLNPWLYLLIRNFIFVTVRIKPTSAFEDTWIYYIIIRCIPPTCSGNLLWPSSRRCFCEEYITIKPVYFHCHIYCTFSQQRHAFWSCTPCNLVGFSFSFHDCLLIYFTLDLTQIKHLLSSMYYVIFLMPASWNACIGILQQSVIPPFSPYPL